MMALPFMESLAPLGGSVARAAGAAAGGGPPLRMAIVSVTGGTVLESWRMRQGGPLAGAKLPSILRPLDFCRDDLLILNGLAHNGKGEGVNGHEHCAFLHLTGAPEVKKVDGKAFAGVSVDQTAARVAGSDTYLPSLEMGLSNSETKYSSRDASAPVPYEANPRRVYERMFRGRRPIVPNWQRRAAAMGEAVRQSARPGAYDQSVLDLVMDDAKDLRGRLGNTDRQKLEEYLQSVRSVERRLGALEYRQKLEAADVAAPGPSTLNVPSNLPPSVSNIWERRDIVHRDPERHAEYIALMADLMILAFQTDTTRVSTLAMGSDEAMFHGVVTVGYERHCHTLEHQGNSDRVENADPIAREACRQIHAWYTGLFAEMVRKMKAIDEGGSSLLDNTMVLYTSYMADGGHGRHDYPALLVGNAKGTLKTGRQVDFQKNTPVSNLYVEMLERMGVKTPGFGESRTSPNAAYDGRLPGLT